MMDGSVMVVFVQKWMKKMRDGDVFVQGCMKKVCTGNVRWERIEIGIVGGING